MNYSTTIMDRRHKGKGSFTHYVSFEGGQKVKNYVDAREWMWETFGPGIERDYARVGEYKWGWQTDNSGPYLRIYFKSTQEFNWFKLKWSGE